MAIGKRIESAMIRAGKKPVDIAKRLKITESAVSQWFHKDTGPKSVRLSELASFLGTTVDYLITEHESSLLAPPSPGPVGPPNAGDDCLLIQEAPDGARYALIKRLVRFNSTSWTVKQWNPDKTFSLPRKEWQRALLVIGKYNRG